jgi:uncharacterized UBP type Zn finger protein
MGTTDNFGGGRSGCSKMDGHIKIDPVFDLQPYLTEEIQKNNTNIFCRLFTVIVHAGKNSHSGYYFAYARSVTANEGCKIDDYEFVTWEVEEK